MGLITRIYTMTSLFQRVWRRSGRCLRRAAAAVAFVVALVSGSHSQAAVVTLDGGGGDASWMNAVNWSSNVLPGPTDDVVISAAAPPAVCSASRLGRHQEPPVRQRSAVEWRRSHPDHGGLLDSGNPGAERWATHGARRDRH